MKTLTIGNTKTVKGSKQGYLTGILHFAPSTLSGREVCPNASEGCKRACLNTAGRGKFDYVQQARIRKTNWFFRDRPGFLLQLVKDIKALERKANRENKIPVVRLNGTSDLSWERYGIISNIFDLFPHIQFYDYTKSPSRMAKYLRGELPSNYHLTFSLSETNRIEADNVINLGGSVAVVFQHDIPEFWNCVPVVSGEENDLRFLDPKNVIVGLIAKGNAKKDTSGFVQIQVQ